MMFKSLLNPLQLGKKRLCMFLLVMMMAALAACSGAEKESPAAQNPPAATENGNVSSETAAEPEEPEKVEESEAEPEAVELTVYDPTSATSADEFMKKYGDAISAKFPHVTLHFVHSPDTNPGGHITSIITAGEPIDIFLNADLNHYRLITPFKLEHDMSEIIKKKNFDLSVIDAGVMESVKSLSSDGESIYALPYSMNVLGLMYNIDLFDRFGQDYPTDGMTWDETYEIARAMTREEDGVQYRGFITQFYNMAWLNQLSVPFVDPETDKTLLNSDERWSKYVNNLVRFFEIPGNELKERTFGAIRNLFNASQTAAMYAYFYPTTEIEGLNWDIVTLPEFPELPGVGSQPMLQLAYVTSYSKHKEAAFDIVAYMASDEFQTERIAKPGIGFPISSNEQVKNAFAQDAPFLEGKNIHALILKSSPAVSPNESPYGSTAASLFEWTMYDLAQGIVDVNTALRVTAEEADQEIAALKAGNE